MLQPEKRARADDEADARLAPPGSMGGAIGSIEERAGGGGESAEVGRRAPVQLAEVLPVASRCKRSETSLAWLLFEKVPGTREVKCLLLSTKGDGRRHKQFVKYTVTASGTPSSSHLVEHLEMWHPTAWDSLKRAKSEMEDVQKVAGRLIETSAGPYGKGKVTKWLTPNASLSATGMERTLVLACWLVEKQIPFNAIKSSYFGSFTAGFSGNVPGQQDISAAIHVLYLYSVGQARAFFSQCGTISLAFDLGTPQHNATSLLALSGSGVSRSFDYQSFAIALMPVITRTFSHTIAALVDLCLARYFHGWGHHLVIATVTTDDGANVRKGGRLLLNNGEDVAADDDTGVRRDQLPCANHAVKNAVDDAFGDGTEVGEAVQASVDLALMKGAITYVNQSSVRRGAVKDAQEALMALAEEEEQEEKKSRSKGAVGLRKWSPTRWEGWFDAIARMCDKRVMTAILDIAKGDFFAPVYQDVERMLEGGGARAHVRLDGGFFDRLEEYLNLLLPLRKISKLAESEKAVISVIPGKMHEVAMELGNEQTDESAAAAALRRVLNASFIKRCAHFYCGCNNFTMAAALDPRTGKLEYMTEVEKNAVWAGLDDAADQLDGLRGDDESGDESSDEWLSMAKSQLQQLRRRMDRKEPAKSTVDVLQWWKEHKLYSALAPLVQMFFAIPPGSSKPERMFLFVNYSIAPRRSRLNLELVEKMAIISDYMNKQKIVCKDVVAWWQKEGKNMEKGLGAGARGIGR